MKHLGINPRWINRSGSVTFPESVAESYDKILEKAKSEYPSYLAKSFKPESIEKHIRSMIVQPCGLKNRHLMCFVNASIQMLFASPRFVSFAYMIKSNYPLFTKEQKDATPTWNKLCSFLNTFNFSTSNNDGALPGLEAAGLNISGAVKDIVVLDPVIGRFSSKRKPLQQEDASEFLSFFLNKLHDELIELKKLGGEFDGNDSPLSRIFATTVITRTYENGKERSANEEFNLVLQLPVKGIGSIKEAIKKYELEEEVTEAIKRRAEFKELPNSLIIGLMRFGYNEYGPTKLTGHVEYPEILKIESKEKKMEYRLVAVVIHIGNSPYLGHYICIARHLDGTWLNFDDDKVSEFTNGKELQQQAYMLLYNKITSVK